MQHRTILPRLQVLIAVLFLIALTCVPLVSAQDEVTIYGLVNDAYARIWQDQLVPEFESRFPGIKVVIDGVPYGEQLSKQMLELTGGNYDFFVTDDPWLPQLASTGLLYDLRADFADVTDPEYDWDDFHPSALASGQYDGGQFSVPIRSNVLLMFYNRSLFTDAGLEEPGEGYTWEQLESDLEQLVRDTNGDGNADVWGIATYFGRDALTPTIWQAIMNSNGGVLLDEDLVPQFNTEVGVEALETHIRLASYGPPGASAYGFTDTLEAFRQARVAVMFNWGSVYFGAAVNPDTTTLTVDQVGISAMPGGTAVEGGAHRGIWTAAVLRNAANPEAAWSFIEWVTSKEGEVWSAANIGQFPARISTLNGETPQPWLEDVYAAILSGYDAIEAGQMWRPRLPDSDGVQQILANHHSRAMIGEVSAAQALADAEVEITEFLTNRGYYDE